MWFAYLREFKCLGNKPVRSPNPISNSLIITFEFVIHIKFYYKKKLPLSVLTMYTIYFNPVVDIFKLKFKKKVIFRNINNFIIYYNNIL